MIANKVSTSRVVLPDVAQRFLVIDLLLHGLLQRISRERKGPVQATAVTAVGMTLAQKMFLLLLALRHYLLVQRQILRTCHMSEKIVQNLYAG